MFALPQCQTCGHQLIKGKCKYGHNNVRQAALTLLVADEGFYERLAEWFYLQVPTGYDCDLRKASVEWKDLPDKTWADHYPAPSGQCGTTIMKAGKDTFRELATSAIRKAAGIKEE